MAKSRYDKQYESGEQAAKQCISKHEPAEAKKRLKRLAVAMREEDPENKGFVDAIMDHYYKIKESKYYHIKSIVKETIENYLNLIY